MQIAAGKFKAQCLSIMDEVQRRHEEVIVTKRGRSVVKVVPVDEPSTPSVFGFLKGHARIKGDIVGPIDVEWNADV